MDALFIELRSAIHSTSQLLKTDLEHCEANLATSGRNTRGKESKCEEAKAESRTHQNVSGEADREGQHYVAIVRDHAQEGTFVHCTHQPCPQPAGEEGMQPVQAYKIVRWWSDVEEIGPEEFAKRANKPRRGVRHSNCNPGADVKWKMAWLDPTVQRVAKGMESLASKPEADPLLLPRLTKDQLKQVETLAILYHLEVRPVEVKSTAKAVYRTEQTAQSLSVGGKLQLDAFLERHRPQNNQRQKRPRPRKLSKMEISDKPSAWLQSKSIGGQMLKALGWKEGQGIGARQQGIIEPVLPQKRKRLLGLGAE